MNIGLLDIDSHNFPNLALMKISAYHKAMGDNVEFADMIGEYDIIYKSKIFSWTPDNNYIYNCEKEIKGGSGYNIHVVLSNQINSICPDYSLYNCKHAYGFLTRGCIRKCEWCIVPNKEGNIRPESDIEDFISDKKTAILMDNNILACDHGIHQIEKISKTGIKVDFNQGLDARLIDKPIAKLLSKVKWLVPLRLACDSQSMIEPIRKAVELLRWENCTPSRYQVYCLIKDIPETIERIKFSKGMYLDPFAQIYRDIKDEFKITKEHEDLERWCNRKSIFKKCTFEDYNKRTVMR